MKPHPVFDTPYKARNVLASIALYPWARFLFWRNGIAWGNGWKIYGSPIIQKHRHSIISFGSRLHLRSSVRSNPLGVNHPVILCTWETGAELLAGDDFAMTGGSLVAARQIMIGSRVVVGPNTVITDTDFHPLDSAERIMSPQAGPHAPVIIEDDVFIGMGCVVLKGVKIGRGSVIGAGSVVTGEIPPGVVAAGNPARVIRAL